MKQELHNHTVAGTYQATSRAFGFLVPEGGGGREDDYFIPPRCEGGAWHGDKVLAAPAESAEQGRRREARITAVTERANKIVTGAIRKEGKEVWLFPDSDKLPGPIRVMGHTKGVKAGDKAAVTMVSFGGKRQPPTGTLRETFGRDGSREASTEAILYGYNIQRQFPDPVLRAAAQAPRAVDPDALAGRLDLRGETVITIDGASAKDLDDAVSLRRDEKGRWVLGVHIADVSHYVTPGSALDQEAWERGTSVYFADQVIPMLPKELSNGICSLNPQVDRLALSCMMTMGEDGAVLDHKIAKTVIRTTERMTYEDCNTLLEGCDPALEDRYRAILPMLRDMARLAKGLEKRRKARGSLDLDTGESYIVCDAKGKPVHILSRTQGVSEALIESFMLAANECMAEHLFQLQKPCIYRVHEKPSLDKTETLQSMLAPLGYDLREADNFTLQRLLDEAEGKPEGPAVNSMVLRSLMKARYDVQNLGHFGLAAKFYCHFTSPIRRYPDLMVHRILTALLGGKLEGRLEAKLVSAAQKAAAQSSQREISAQSAEREIEKLYMAEYMSGHLGEALQGAVSGVTRFGLFVVLESGVEGMVPVETLPGDHYAYDERRMTLTGDLTGAVFSFGMPLAVVCIAADPGSGQIDFRLAGEAPGSAAPRRKKERTIPPKREGRSVHAPKRGKRKKGRRG